MSRWLPDQLHIHLAPDQVVLERRVMGLGLAGVEAKLRVKDTFAVARPTPERPWSGALQVLETALAALPERHHDATVVLSNHFVRYGLVPWSEMLGTAEEETALARHYFRSTYGEAVDRWELRVSVEPSASRQLAGAVDRELLADLRSLFAATQARLVSIQPGLMAVCNGHRTELGGDAWLLMAEPGAICLGLLEHGEFARLRSLRSGPSWEKDLATILTREAYLAEVDDPPQDVLLWTREGGQCPADAGNWHFHLLQDQFRPAAADQPQAATQ